MRFNPKQLSYSPEGVPILKTEQIEDVAQEFLEKYCPLALTKPWQIPVADIIRRLGETTGLRFVFADLGQKGTAKILGSVNFTTKTLTLDTALAAGERQIQYRFTAAHEIGHWVLHRWNYKSWKFPAGTQPSEDMEDDEKTLCRLDQKTPQDWLEWQANVFAAELVLPRTTFPKALAQTQLELGIHRNLGQVWLSDADYSRRDFQQLATRLSTVYGVSKTSVRVRLATLGLLHDLSRS